MLARQFRAAFTGGAAMLVLTRRTALLAGAAFAGVAPAAAQRPPLTPRQTEGPFYPRLFPLDVDADLVQVQGRAGRARGTVAYLSGRLATQDGRAVPGAAVEIWQCDAGGVYHHVGEHSRGADPNFQGFGRATTDAAGAFRFRTIKPMPYPGRTPHIHAIVAAPGMPRLTTQLYVAGEPGNERDGLYRSIRDPAQRALVTLAYRPAPELEAGALLAEPRIVIGG
jgi:protocatechuate 3,4-dioxygenase beta subunit